MQKLTDNQITALRDITHKAHVTADMIEGCKNRMCVCDTEEELDRLFIGLIQHANKLYTQNKQRLYAHNHPDFDKPTTITL